ncbi:sulfotransferase family protein [Parvularcula dongshanensis]|uniref:LPS sulfotransferase NodH n=1 Tax=Parvularcula dongshanensis TaxID=1173995 RepID=A0A840I131_9PROT|nr:sulfotransferase [Parvularcula dongshanensis]MBB4658055.1 LPS sulfotransferase NodH [Parvularcula dongshanensis]
MADTRGALDDRDAAAGAQTDPLASPVFVLGMGRSGTTLLARLLSGTAALDLMPEERHFFAMAERHPSNANGTLDVGAFWRDYTRSVRFADAGVDASACYARAVAADDVTLTGLFRAMLAEHADRTGAARVGEKTTDDAAHVDTLLGAFPDARFILVERDPRAAIASQLKAPWNDVFVRHADGTPSPGGRLGKVARYAMIWRQFSKLAEAKAGAPYLTVLRYEDLVAREAETMERVWRFLGEDGIPPARDDAAYNEDVVELGNPKWNRWRTQHFEKSQGAVNEASLAKWRKQLTKLEVAVIEGVCGASLAASGYERTTSAAQRAAGRLVAQAIDRFGLFLNPVREDDMKFER